MGRGPNKGTVTRRPGNRTVVPRFSFTNPNKVRAVFGGLATGAPAALFTRETLHLLGEIICVVDQSNGNLAASLCKMLQVWRKLTPELSLEARKVLEAVLNRPGCSKNAKEVVETTLR